MAGKRTTSGRRPAQSVAELFALNDELKRFLPTAVDRAQALGVSRETVGAWDRRRVSERVRGDNLHRLRRSVGVCQEAAKFMSTTEQVGSWLKAPQTFLYGATPLDYLADDGDARFLVENIPPPVARVSEATKEIHRQTRSALAALVGPAPERARARRQTATARSASRRAEVEKPAAHLFKQVDQPRRSKRNDGPRRHVVPATGGGWKVIKEGGGRASAHVKTKSEATARAREIVGRLGSGEVVIHGRDGRVKTSQTVGRDSSPTRR